MRSVLNSSLCCISVIWLQDDHFDSLHWFESVTFHLNKRVADTEKSIAQAKRTTDEVRALFGIRGAFTILMTWGEKLISSIQASNQCLLFGLDQDMQHAQLTVKRLRSIQVPYCTLRPAYSLDTYG